MKAICELTKEEYARYASMTKNLDKLLKSKGIQKKDIWQQQDYRKGYAHYTFEVIPSQKVLEAIGRPLTIEEVIILVDGGFSHFGATCYLEGCNHYRGRVNID